MHFLVTCYVWGRGRFKNGGPGGVLPYPLTVSSFPSPSSPRLLPLPALTFLVVYHLPRGPLPLRQGPAYSRREYFEIWNDWMWTCIFTDFEAHLLPLNKCEIHWKISELQPIYCSSSWASQILSYHLTLSFSHTDFLSKLKTQFFSPIDHVPCPN